MPNPNIYIVGARDVDKTTYKLDSTGSDVWDTDHGADGNGIAVDADGNVYTCGKRTAGDLTTRKYSESGSIIWSIDHGADVNGIAVDTDGNVYTCGVADANDYAIKKYDSDGDLIWSTAFLDVVTCISVDIDGNVYAGGVREGTESVAKFDPDGDEIWSADFNTDVYGICVDYNGYVFVAGKFASGSANVNVQNAGSNVNGIYEYDDEINGEPSYVRGDNIIFWEGSMWFLSPKNDVAFPYYWSTSGLLTGDWEAMRGAPPPPDVSYAFGESYNIWVLDNDGGMATNFLLGGVEIDQPHASGICIGESIMPSNIEFFACGPAHSDFNIAKYNAFDPKTPEWSIDFGADLSGIALDQDGNIYVCGESNGNENIAKYDADGDLIWGESYLDGSCNGICVDPGVYGAGFWLEPDNIGNTTIQVSTGATATVSADNSGESVITVSSGINENLIAEMSGSSTIKISMHEGEIPEYGQGSSIIEITGDGIGYARLGYNKIRIHTKTPFGGVTGNVLYTIKILTPTQYEKYRIYAKGDAVVKNNKEYKKSNISTSNVYCEIFPISTDDYANFRATAKNIFGEEIVVYTQKGIELTKEI